MKEKMVTNDAHGENLLAASLAERQLPGPGRFY